MAKYTIEKRFDVWVTRTIEADNLEVAAKFAEEAGITQFFKHAHSSVEITDYNDLIGTCAREKE